MQRNAFITIVYVMGINRGLEREETGVKIIRSKECHCKFLSAYHNPIIYIYKT